MIEDTAEDRWQRAPRPLNFVRVRLYRDGQAEYIRSLLEDEQDQLFEDLGRMREEGKDENGPEIEECRTNLRHLINFLKDINQGMIELR